MTALRRHPVLAALLIAVILAFAKLATDDPASTLPTEDEKPAPETPLPQQANAARTALRTGAASQSPGAVSDGDEPVPPMPASLADTEVDGTLTVAPDGAFWADAGAVRFFEYFLTAKGELDERALRRLIIARMQARLPASALPGAVEFLDQYLSYRRESGDVSRRAHEPEQLDSALDQLYAMRREIFGEKVAERVFTEDEALRTAALEQRQLKLDEKLGDEEREKLLAAAEEELPPEMRKAREVALIPLRVAEIQKGITDPAEARAKLEALVGKEAADRLEELERTRQDFARRIDAYKQARAAIRARRSLSGDAKVREERALFERTFSVDERARAEALTR